MIDREGELTVKCQAELLELSRSSLYYTPRPVLQRDLLLMRRLDERVLVKNSRALKRLKF